MGNQSESEHILKIKARKLKKPSNSLSVQSSKDLWKSQVFSSQLRYPIKTIGNRLLKSDIGNLVREVFSFLKCWNSVLNSLALYLSY